MQLYTNQVEQILAVLEYTQNRVNEDPESEARAMTLTDVQTAIDVLGGLPQD